MRERGVLGFLGALGLRGLGVIHGAWALGFIWDSGQVLGEGFWTCEGGV